jgi:hypothetical protein
MRKFLIVLLLATILLSSCESDYASYRKDTSRFIPYGDCFRTNISEGKGPTLCPIEDTVTKALYLVVATLDGSGGVTPWLDSDGKPLLAP